MEDNRFASRKFILTALAALIPIALLIFHYIDQGTYADITKWVIGLYFTGNVVEKSTLVTGAK